MSDECCSYHGRKYRDANCLHFTCNKKFIQKTCTALLQDDQLRSIPSPIPTIKSSPHMGVKDVGYVEFPAKIAYRMEGSLFHVIDPNHGKDKYVPSCHGNYKLTSRCRMEITACRQTKVG